MTKSCCTLFVIKLAVSQIILRCTELFKLQKNVSSTWSNKKRCHVFFSAICLVNMFFFPSWIYLHTNLVSHGNTADYTFPHIVHTPEAHAYAREACRGVFRTLSNIEDGAFCEKQYIPHFPEVNRNLLTSILQLK